MTDSLNTSDSIYHISFIEYLYRMFKHSPAIVTTIINRLVFFPFFGTFSRLINSSYPMVVFCTMIAILVLKKIPLTLMRHVLVNNKLLTLSLLMQIALLFLIMLVRPFNIGASYLGRINSVHDPLAAKYLIFVTPMAVIFWYMVFAKLKSKKSYLICFFLLIVAANYNRIILPTFYNTLNIDPKPRNWYTDYQNLDNGISIEIAPSGWTIPSSSQNLHSK